MVSKKYLVILYLIPSWLILIPLFCSYFYAKDVFMCMSDNISFLNGTDVTFCSNQVSDYKKFSQITLILYIINNLILNTIILIFNKTNYRLVETVSSRVRISLSSV
jgi:hypothetical protein